MACVIPGNTSETSVAIGLQSACGTPQTSLNLLRTTGNQLQFTAQSTESEEIRPDRNVADLIRTAGSVGGTISGELSYSTYALLIQAVLQSTTPLDGTGTVITNGTTKGWFTIETNKPVDTTDYFEQFSDMQVNTWSVTIPTADKVTTEFGFLGSSAPVTSGTSLDGSYGAATTTPVYNSNYHVKTITIDGATTYKVQSLSFSVSNNMAEQRAIGDVVAGGVSSGKITVTGSASVFFADNTLQQAFLDNDSFDVGVLWDDLTGVTNGNQTEVTMPNCKFASSSIPIQGNNGSIVQNFTFQAIYDATLTGSIGVSQLVAAP